MDELELVSADGTVTALTDLVDDIDVLAGLTGRFAPPAELVADRVANRDGARLRVARADVRDIVIPLSVEPLSEPALRARLRDLVSAVWPSRGDVLLRAVRPEGARQIRGRYAGGLEIVEDFGTTVSGVANAGLVLRCFDPFWEDVDPDVSFAKVDAIAFLSSDSQEPWFPWQTVEVDVQGGFTVNNDGDDLAFPVWTVQGPGGAITLVNITTGQTLEIDTALSAGQQVRIDTRPDVKTVVGPAGVNLWPQVTDPSTLWPIVRGSQLVNVQIVDAVPGETQVRLEWRRRWLSA